MKKVEARVETRRGPEEVYAYLVDFANQVEWRFDVLESTLISGRAGEVGARYRQRVKPGRRESVSEVELTRAEPGRAVGFRTVDEGPVAAEGVFRIEAAGGGSRLVNDIKITPRGFVRLFEPLMGPSLRKTAARYERALRERLDGEPAGR